MTPEDVCDVCGEPRYRHDGGFCISNVNPENEGGMMISEFKLNEDLLQADLEDIDIQDPIEDELEGVEVDSISDSDEEMYRDDVEARLRSLIGEYLSFSTVSELVQLFGEASK